MPTSVPSLMTRSAPTFLFAMISTASNTVASGETEKISVPFWPRIASIVPLTSMFVKRCPCSESAEVECETNDVRRAWQYFSAPGSGSFRSDEIELALLRSRSRGGGRRDGVTQGAQNSQTALDPIGADRVRHGDQIATRIMNLVS